MKTYSGGMRRRLDLAGALVAEPQVLFLDEPTARLDPRSRTDLWDVIRELVSKGTTLLLTTQYLEEADQLADRIVVIDRGVSIAEGTSHELKRTVGGERIELTLASRADFHAANAILSAVGDGDVQVDDRGTTLTAPITNGLQVLSRVLRDLDKAGVAVGEVGLRHPTLDDVFLTLTGHVAEFEDKPPKDDEEIDVGVRAS